jgi:hypothetical protein
MATHSKRVVGLIVLAITCLAIAIVCAGFWSANEVEWIARAYRGTTVTFVIVGLVAFSLALHGSEDLASDTFEALGKLLPNKWVGALRREIAAFKP